MHENSESIIILGFDVSFDALNVAMLLCAFLIRSSRIAWNFQEVLGQTRKAAGFPHLHGHESRRLCSSMGSFGMQFETSGPIDVRHALVPVNISLEHDFGVYVEPGVWVDHRL